MTVACVIKGLTDVQRLSATQYVLTADCIITDLNNSAFQVTYTVTKGQPMKNQSASAVSAWVTSHLGETVDLVIFPGLDTVVV